MSIDHRRLVGNVAPAIEQATDPMGPLVTAAEWTWQQVSQAGQSSLLFPGYQAHMVGKTAIIERVQRSASPREPLADDTLISYDATAGCWVIGTHQVRRLDSVLVQSADAQYPLVAGSRPTVRQVVGRLREGVILPIDDVLLGDSRAEQIMAPLSVMGCSKLGERLDDIIHPRRAGFAARIGALLRRK